MPPLRCKKAGRFVNGMFSWGAEMTRKFAPDIAVLSANCFFTVHMLRLFSTIVLYINWLKMFSVTPFSTTSWYASSRVLASDVMPSGVQQRALKARMGASASRPYRAQCVS